MTSGDWHGGDGSAGLSLQPFVATRPHADAEALASLLCPPYDVISAGRRAELLQRNPANAVSVILPPPDEDGYAAAAATLQSWVGSGTWRVDAAPTLYVYEMREAAGHATRGLVGAVGLREPEDGVILPHENTMAGPVADRLALMTSTGADLEPIYLVYDGGGAASQVVRTADAAPTVASTTTPDGVSHRLWAVTDPAVVAEVADDLAPRRALIADGHHRYATYLERRRRHRTDGPGPWDRGLAFLVDSLDFGPQVHPIHRYVTHLGLSAAVELLPAGSVHRSDVPPGLALESLPSDDFGVVLTDGHDTYLVGGRSALGDDDGDEHTGEGRRRVADTLDVSVVHRRLVRELWQRSDDVESLGYAHTVDEAIASARADDGFAVLLRSTPVAAVTAVAAAGERMPRKSTLFTPKPASGLLVRRLADQRPSVSD